MSSTSPAMTPEEQARGLLQQGRSLAEICILLARQEIGAPYVYGAWGGECTPAYRRQYAGYNPQYKDKIYGRCPALSGTGACANCAYRGRRAYDCRGFVRWVLQQAGVTVEGSGATTQYATAKNWAQRGPIAEMPDLPLTVLYRQDGARMAHTGLYVGDSRAVHCSGEVKEDPLSAGHWTHYAVPKGLYTEAELAAGNARRLPPTLRRGDRGESVARLQRLLLAQGYDLGHAGADGVFGAATMAAVQAFQRASGLQADGVADADTQAALAAASQTDGDLSALRAALAACLADLDRIIGAQHG